MIWGLAEPSELGPRAREILADRRHEILFSVVSVWELLIKKGFGKLRLDHRELVADAATAGFARIGIELAHLDQLAVQGKHHGDPFDHLLIAQAIAEGAAFMSRDRKADRYPVELVSPVR